MTEYTFIKRGLQSLKNKYPFKVLKRIDKENEPFYVILINDEGFKVALCHLKTAESDGIGYLIERGGEITDYLKIQDEMVMKEAGDITPGLEIFKDKNLREYSCMIPSPFPNVISEILAESSIRIVGLTIDELFSAISSKKKLKLTAVESSSNLYGTEEIVCKAEIV